MNQQPSRAVELIDTRLREIKSLSVGLSRGLRDVQHRLGSAEPLPPAAATLIRSFACRLLGHGKGGPLDVAASLYRDQPEVSEALTDTRAFLARAVTNPASTTDTAWAGVLASVPATVGAIPLLAPASTYAALAARGLRVSFEGVNAVSIPRRADTPNLAGVFVGEGLPIPVKSLALSSSMLAPKKAAVISLFSGELQKRSVPTIESVIRQCMNEDTAAAVDGILLGSSAATSAAPPGLLNGVVPIAATAGGDLAALAGDLGNLAAAVDNPADLVYLMNEAERVRALVLAPGLVAVTILSAALPPKTVVALDAADFASGESDTPSFDISSEAIVHAEDSAPLPISTAATVASPTTSLWQVNTFGLRMITDLAWGLRRPNRIATIAGVTW